MKKVIVGIHGLANKPPREPHAQDWKRSLLEGLANLGAKNAAFDFDLVYWADRLYKQPLHTDANYSFDANYDGEPYVPAVPGALQKYDEGFLDRLRAKALDVAGSVFDFTRQKLGMDRLSSWLLGRLLKDLAFYYDAERTIDDGKGGKAVARKVLDAVLERALLAHQGKEILVIAHSMGSIIAYNVLRDLGQRHPTLKVAEFVTVGSPLGLPYVKGKIVEERTYDPKVRTPSCVTRSWINYADKKDPIALDVHLRDDYGPNKAGVRVVDDLVLNDYHTTVGGEREHNHHKIYGYLRAPELAAQVRKFLGA